MSQRFLLRLLANAFAVVVLTVSGHAVLGQAYPQVTATVDDSKLFPLSGNVLPQLTSAKDMGLADRNQPAGRVMLVLARPQEQETALQNFLQEAHRQASPTFHRWLAPGQFGKDYGAADSDIVQITAWLQSRGLRVIGVSSGKGTLEFTGTVGQVGAALHTSIHRYDIKGETHFANSTPPQVPAAFGKVILGVLGLDDFKAKPLARVMGRSSYNSKTHAGKPQWTIPGIGGFDEAYFLAPEDFATQYDVKPVYLAGVNGANQTIGIIDDSNIDISLVNAYRKLFGLVANPPQIVLDGEDPGINGDADEAYLDVENAGAVAPGAAIKLYVSGSIIYGMVRAVNDDAASILSLSFNTCEENGTAYNAFINSLWEQAAAQGQTVLVSTGDSGSYGCYGLGVNGFASTPWTIGVGGTDIYLSDYASGGASLAGLWTNANDSNQGSLQAKFAEQPWNGSQFGLNSGTYLPLDYMIGNISGGGGGASACAVGGDDFDPDSGLPICISGYAKPSWQTGTGVPNDSVRDLPDVALFASNLVNGVIWPICAEAGDCTSIDPNTNVTYVTGVGGTSASAPAMAGIMALVNQKYGPQGQANYTLYPLAAQFPSAFTDISIGNNNEPCPSGAIGYLIGCAADTNGDGYDSLQHYSADAGFDLATGLGTIDVNNLLANWSKITFAPSKTTLTATPASITHGQSVQFNASVTGTGTPAGVVALVSTSTLPNNKGIGGIELQSGTGQESITYLPGGTYTITGEYSGDGINGTSQSQPVNITVAPEPSTVLQTPYAFSYDTYSSAPFAAGSTIPYGNAIALVASIAGVSGTPGNATGTATFTDGSAKLGVAAIRADSTVQMNGSFLAPGPHTIGVSYSGDDSYNPSTATPFSFTIAKAPSEILTFTGQLTTLNADGSLGFTAGQSPTVAVTVQSFDIPFGASPTGSISYQLGSAQPVTVALVPNENVEGYVEGSVASFVIANLPLGTQTFTASYGGDANYGPTTQTLTIEVTAAQTLLPSTTTLSFTTPASLANLPPGATIIAVATVTGSGNVAPTGTIFPIIGSAFELGAFTLQPLTSNTSSASFTFRAADLPAGNNSFNVSYSGDSVYSGSSSAVIVLPNDNSDFTIQAATPNVVIKSGANESAVLNLASINSFNGTVTLSCTISSGLSCSATPTSISLNGNAEAMVSIVAGGPTSASTAWPTGAARAITGTLFASFVFLLLPRRRRLSRIVVALIFATGLIGMGGCSNESPSVTSSPGAKAGTYTAVVTATGYNGIMHNTTITVFIQ